MLHNSFRCAAKENVFQPCASMRWHDDEIGGDGVRQPTDFIEGRCATEHIAGRRRDAAFTGHFLELVERGLFCILVVSHEGKWDNRRSWCHEVCCVIEMTNMG